MARRLSVVGQSARLSVRRLSFELLEPRQMLAAFDVLVFSKTAGFRHDSIDEGLAAIQALGAANDFSVTHTEDAALFTEANLAQYEAVVFLNTTGDVFNVAQETAFQNYIARAADLRACTRQPIPNMPGHGTAICSAPISQVTRRFSRRRLKLQTMFTRRPPIFPIAGSGPMNGTTTR